MRHPELRLCLCLCLLISAIGFLTAIPALGTDEAAPKSDPGDSELAPPPEVPKGWTAVDENIWTILADEPDTKMDQARASFARQDGKAAAREIRKAASLLKLEAGRAGKEGKADLLAAISDLETMAGSLENGTVTTTAQIDHAFARTHQALAARCCIRAKRDWTDNDPAGAGQELLLAATHLDQGLRLGGGEVPASAAAVVKTTRGLAGKLAAGTGWTSEEAERGMTALGGEIERLGATLRGSR